MARRSFRSNAMSSSVTVGLITLSTLTCCPRGAAPAPALPPPNAVAVSLPPTNAPAKPAAPAILNFIILLLTVDLLLERTSENTRPDCMLIQLRRQWINTSSKRGQLSTNADWAAAYAAAQTFSRVPGARQF